jgi:hypothetical protein
LKLEKTPTGRSLMNLRMDIDVTPEEMRKLLGLPDVEAFQRQLMDDIRRKMSEGAEGYDPLKLFQPYLSSTLASWEMFQKMFSAAAASRPTGAGDEK